MVSTGSAPTIQQIRAQFPALKGDFVFLENAGGSQLPKVVIDAMRELMENSYVQTGAGYPASDRATATSDRAHQFLLELFNGVGIGHVAIGPSTTALLYMLSNCLAEVMSPGDEIVVQQSSHESHLNPWYRIADRFGFTIKVWEVEKQSGLSLTENLIPLLNDKTKLVCVTQTSNLVGDCLDLKQVAQITHQYGALVVADCVASASHQAIDVKDWDLDFAVFSNYKVYGPHTAALYGKTEAWARLSGPNHFFLPNVGAKKFELGCLSYEALAGINALEEYLKFLAGTDVWNRQTITTAFEVMKAQEQPVQRRLLDYLSSKKSLWILGELNDMSQRHPTIAFRHPIKSSSEIAQFVNQRGIGIRYGNMYAYRLCEGLGIPVDDGVVRISAVHYNTVEEIDRLVEILDQIL